MHTATLFSRLSNKWIGILALLLIGTSALSAQSATSAYEPENEGWLVHLDKAFEEHEKTGKPIMANFTGSDWCGWCKQLTRTVFSKEEFKTWAADNVVLLELDFPKRKKIPADVAQQNRGLQQAFGVRGYPSVWVFDLEKDDAGKFNISALGKTGYTKTAKEFISGVEAMIARRGAN